MASHEFNITPVAHMQEMETVKLKESKWSYDPGRNFVSVTIKTRAGKGKFLTAFPNATSRKLAMGFTKNAKLCGICRFFQWLEVGSKNRCAIGDFTTSSRHGCNFYQPDR